MCQLFTPSLAAHLIDTSRFRKVPDIAGAVVQRSFGPPFELLFRPSNFSDAETYVASSTTNFPCWNGSL